MRKNSNDWSLACGVKAGHHHLYKGSNCQDAAAMITAPDIAIGIGCDGCGEGEHSEMGALATVNFALHEASQLHTAGYRPSEIVQQLFPAIVRFIDMNVLLTCSARGIVEIANFIKHHWLSTIMGVILTCDESIIFWCGDGTFAIDDEAVVSIDQQNQPTYIAYNCLFVPDKVGVSKKDIPVDFSSMVITPKSRVMIASDGFGNHNKQKLFLSREREPELPDCLHGQQWNKKGQFGLNKWMNSRSDRGYFEDDCLIITAEALNA